MTTFYEDHPLLAFGAGVVAWFAAYMLLRGLVWAVDLLDREPNTPDEGYQKYGHPHAPVPALHKKLPKPPEGFAWEIKVEPGESERPTLILDLVNIGTGETVDSKRRDLILKAKGYYWAEVYRITTVAGWHFDTDLIGPFIDWAQKQVDKHTTYTTPGEYLMKVRDD